MTSDTGIRLSRWLSTVGFVFGAATALAAGGFTITQSEEARIAIGMSDAEVQKNLGRPARIHQYRGLSGPTWTYEVASAPFGRTDFEIDFGADGKVTSAGEKLYGSRH